jgi:hypothetical protein
MSDAPTLPPPSLTALIDMLGAQAFVALGGYAPEGGEATVDIVHAQFMIELLRVLRDKTESARTDDETTRLNETLDGLQRSYVSVKQQDDADS